MSHLLTVVTVVKDDPDGLRRTLASMESSRIDDPTVIEWIIVDSSRDPGSIEKLTATSALTPVVIWVAPEGVYPAMNVGLERASGEYVYFLNAGEDLHDEHSLSQVIDALTTHQPQWLYGQVAFVDAHGHRVVPAPFDYQRERSALFARGRFPPHQGTIVRTKVLRDLGGFDTSFRIAADYAIALRLSQVADPVELETTIATFYTGGLSTVQWRESLREFHRARLEVFTPTGGTAARELFNTGRQFMTKALHRSRARGRSSET